MMFLEYDKALWLILKNDNRNKKKILEFIRTIPSEFIFNIQDSIKLYNMMKNSDLSVDDLKTRNFNGEIYTGDGYFYSYSIDIEKDMLFIGRSIYENGAYYNDFRLSLNSVDLNIDKNNLVNYNIGGILSASLFEERISINYNVSNTRLGSYLFKCINNEQYRLCGFLSRDIPDDYNLENFENRLVKIRKKYIGDEK